MKSCLLGNAFSDKNNWFRWLERQTATLPTSGTTRWHPPLVKRGLTSRASRPLTGQLKRQSEPIRWGGSFPLATGRHFDWLFRFQQLFFFCLCACFFLFNEQASMHTHTHIHTEQVVSIATGHPGQKNVASDSDCVHFATFYTPFYISCIPPPLHLHPSSLYRHLFSKMCTPQ